MPRFVQNAAMRRVALASYRAYARAQPWRTGPRIFINSIPKAGTHLMTAELSKFPGIQNSRLHLEVLKIRLGDRFQYAEDGSPLIDYTKAERAIRTVRPGQFFSGHLSYSDALEKLVRDHKLHMIFMTRDPRDILVSRMHYIAGLRRHWLHDEMMANADTIEDRYRFMLEGCRDPFILSFPQQLANFAPWTNRTDVLVIRFEDLVGVSGGGTVEQKQQALARIAVHCGISTDEIDRIATSDRVPTATLRKGKKEAWRTELPPAIADLMNRKFGHLLTVYGYAPE